MVPDAVVLLIERGQEVQPDIASRRESALAFAEIVRRLDGLPLAIELAAARLSILDPEALLARLSTRLPLLTGGARDLPDRLRTMRDAIAWSYDLLQPLEQALLQRLAVIPGSFTLDAAAVVADEPSDLDAFDLMSSLVEQNLVRRLEVADGTSRFSMLATIREFSLERLEESGDADATRDRHARWTVSLAEEARPHLEGTESTTWLLRLAAEDHSLRAALDWAAARRDAAIALRLTVALFRYWYIYGKLHEGRDQLHRALAAADADDVPSDCGPVRCTSSPTSCSTSATSTPPTIAWSRHSPAGPRPAIRSAFPRALQTLGTVAEYRGDDETATAHYAPLWPCSARLEICAASASCSRTSRMPPTAAKTLRRPANSPRRRSSIAAPQGTSRPSSNRLSERRKWRRPRRILPTPPNSCGKRSRWP